MKLKFIHDSGHGWLEVPLDEFPDAEKYGTGYGYLDEKSRTIYLEEDVEARMFIVDHTYLSKDIEAEYHDGDAPLRMLPRNKALMNV